MKSDATYAGDPRRLSARVMGLRERVKTLRKEACDDYARAEQAEAELVQARAEIEWLKKNTNAFFDCAATLRSTAPRPAGPTFGAGEWSRCPQENRR